MRSQDEIVKRIEERKSQDLFGFEVEEYLGFLDYEHAKPYLKEGVTEEVWNSIKEDYTKENLAFIMTDYLGFAFDKVRNRRGVSAIRSLMHYKAWLWLYDDEKEWPEERIKNLLSYRNYGISHLETIREYLTKENNRLSDNAGRKREEPTDD